MKLIKTQLLPLVTFWAFTAVSASAGAVNTPPLDAPNLRDSGANNTHPTQHSHPNQQAFFNTLSALCGKAFEGKVVKDNDPSPTFSDNKLVMHVRECSDTQLHIPFHVGDDRSRTWIITRTGSGLSLKHDHRHVDGSEDKLTMYGGIAVEPGYAQVQAFPADSYTKWMFAEQGLAQSIGNTWKMFVYPAPKNVFTYQLVREGREFRVDFDLSSPVQTPPVPWGY